MLKPTCVSRATGSVVVCIAPSRARWEVYGVDTILRSPWLELGAGTGPFSVHGRDGVVSPSLQRTPLHDPADEGHAAPLPESRRGGQHRGARPRGADNPRDRAGVHSAGVRRAVREAERDAVRGQLAVQHVVDGGLVHHGRRPSATPGLLEDAHLVLVRGAGGKQVRGDVGADCSVVWKTVGRLAVCSHNQCSCLRTRDFKLLRAVVAV